MLANKCIIIGITGGIAAYKVPELVSMLVKSGAEVHVIMTDSASHFVTPLTLQTVSRNAVSTEMFNTSGEPGVQHIELADKADLFVVVPATANIIGKVRAGIADDILTTVIMATTAPVLLVPAMNVHMYENQIVQDNISFLKAKGYSVLEPATGRLACGYIGKGRLPELETIYNKIVEMLSEHQQRCLDFEGKTVLVTAGPTREYLDPVRFLTNGSTGKMGYAIAEAVRERGGHVVLVSGPVNLPVPQGVTYIPVVSADDMYEAVKKNFGDADVVIKAAAVGDYKPFAKYDKKIKKSNDALELKLDRTPDILKFLGENKGNRVLVGFAAETDNVIQNALKKIKDKNLDFIVANDVTLPGAGFGADTNIVKILHREGKEETFPQMSKREVADCILDRVVTLLNNK